MGDHQAEGFNEELAEFVFVHRDVVRRTRENGGGFLPSEERVIGLWIQGVPTEEPVVAKDPKILGARYWGAVGGLKLVRGIRGFSWRLERLNAKINLGPIETRHLDLEIERSL
jgi:hypothetical protein